MALVLGFLCLCLGCTATAWYIPPPESKKTTWPKFKQVADGRVVYDRQAVPIEVTSKDAKMPSIEVARWQCEADWTCKGFCVWKETMASVAGIPGEEKWYVLKYKTPPDPFKTIPGYFTKKEDAKIFLKID